MDGLAPRQRTVAVLQSTAAQLDITAQVLCRRAQESPDHKTRERLCSLALLTWQRAQHITHRANQLTRHKVAAVHTDPGNRYPDDR